MGDSAGRIEWSYTPRTSRLLRVLVYVPFAVLGGLSLLVICLVGWLVIDALVTGDIGTVALAVGGVFAGLFVVVRGPAAIWLLPDERERLTSELDLPLRRRSLLVASAAGAAVLFVAAGVAFRFAAGVFLGGIATLVVVSFLRSDGSIDPEHLTLEYDTREVPLAALKNVRTITFGPLALCWFSFARGSTGARAPRFVALPVDVYRRAHPVFERGVGRPAEQGRTAPFAERAVFVVLGLGLLAVGPVLWELTAGDPDAVVVVSLAGGMTGVFGLLLVWLAVTN